MRIKNTVKNIAKILCAVAFSVYALPRIWTPLAKCHVAMKQISNEMTWEQTIVCYAFNMLIMPFFFKAISPPDYSTNPALSTHFSRDNTDQAEPAHPTAQRVNRTPFSLAPSQ